MSRPFHFTVATKMARRQAQTSLEHLLSNNSPVFGPSHQLKKMAKYDFQGSKWRCWKMWRSPCLQIEQHTFETSLYCLLPVLM